MRDNICDTILVSGIGLGFIEQNRSSSVRDKTPVLHRTHSLKRNGELVCTPKENGYLTNSWTARRSALGRGYSISNTSEK